jgi:hypothetical protein
MAAGSRDARLLVLNLLALLLILVFLPLHYLGVEPTVNQHLPNSRNYDCGTPLHPNPRPNELIDADEQNARLYPELVSGRPTLVVLCHDALIRERSYVIAACVPASLILVLIVVLTVRLRVAARRREKQSRLLFLPNRVAIPAICILIVLSTLWLGALSL